jgi:hypothetical protein
MEKKIKLQTFFEVLFRVFVCTAFGNGEIRAGDTSEGAKCSSEKTFLLNG